MTQGNSEKDLNFWQQSSNIAPLSRKNIDPSESIETYDEESYPENNNLPNYTSENNESEIFQELENQTKHTEVISAETIKVETIEKENPQNLVLDESHHSSLKYMESLEKLALHNSLDYSAQEELSQLIILHNKIENTSRKDWLKLIDYAILILDKKPTEKLINSPQKLSFLQKITHQWEKMIYGESDHVNLRLARNIRKKIEWQLLFYNSPLLGVITASGKDYTQLISGLTWFFLIFVIVPYYGIALFISGEKSEMQKNMEFLNQGLLKENEQLEIELKTLQESHNTLNIENIEKTNNLQQLESEKQAKDTKINELNSQIETFKKEQAKLQETIKNLQKKPEAKPTTFLNNYNNDQAILIPNYSFKNQFDSGNPNLFNDPLIIAQNTEVLPPTENQNNSPDQTTNSSIIKNKLYFENRETITLIIAVVIAGALGSAISVIVRADDIIAKQSKTTQSLFFTGFFKPIIGMSFAIFLFAILESNLLGISLSMSGEKKIYMYIAVSFVAGFSERLGKDIISQTEDILTNDDEDESSS